MPKSKQKGSDDNPNNICFSFLWTLKECGKGKDFTNQVPLQEIRKYRTIIESSLQDWSGKTIQKLEKNRTCYPVRKAKIDETRNNIAKIFQTAKYPNQWIKQNIKDPDIYKFKISKQIRIFGIVERNIVYILLYDIWHLINKSKKKNFSTADKLVCTWCLKSCDKEEK